MNPTLKGGSVKTPEGRERTFGELVRPAEERIQSALITKKVAGKRRIKLSHFVPVFKPAGEQKKERKSGQSRSLSK